MSSKLSKKALREIEKAQKNKDYDFFVDDKGKYDDPMCCYLRFKVEDGMYKGQVHVLQIKFIYGNGEYNYPADPPNVLFKTPIRHANVEPRGGSICLDVIKSDAWSPMYGLEAVISSIILLLGEPNTDSPYNIEASHEYDRLIKQSDGIRKITDIYNDYYSKKLASHIDAQKILNAPEFDRE